MKNKSIILLTSFLAMVILPGFLLLSTNPETPPAGSYDYVIKKIDGEWKVVDSQDHSKTQLKVKRNDKIVWKAEGTDVFIQFNNSGLFDAETEADMLAGGYTKSLKDGKKLKLKIKEDAPLGTYYYAVFCMANQEFAKGGSPPKIIIE